jgi:hypothetical protein
MLISALMLSGTRPKMAGEDLVTFVRRRAEARKCTGRALHERTRGDAERGRDDVKPWRNALTRMSHLEISKFQDVNRKEN